jgi:predicted DNA-binding antitoxin AbrB/MazE fold protein
MGTEIIEAVYEHGRFRLIQPAELKLAEGQKVRLVMEPIVTSNDILTLATQIFDGLTGDQVDAIEEHFQRRENFFRARQPL